MKLIGICFLFSCSLVFAQKPEGNWQGLLIRTGQKPEQANIVYLQLSPENTCYSREELPGKVAYAYRKCSSVKKGDGIVVKQEFIEKKKDAAGNRWCAMEISLRYNDTTGYLEGNFKSTECRGIVGRIICYPSTEKLNSDATAVELQSWRPIFVDDLKHNRKSAAKRAEERANFKFEPIYFDYDKADIRNEYSDFLRSIIKVVLSHTDLRVKVTGYTDSDGSDEYNVDLSKRRAQAIIDFFVGNGLPADRIKIDFKGETDPIGNNHTSEGKQLNRRVDFSFI